MSKRIAGMAICCPGLQDRTQTRSTARGSLAIHSQAQLLPSSLIKVGPSLLASSLRQGSATFTPSRTGLASLLIQFGHRNQLVNTVWAQKSAEKFSENFVKGKPGNVELLAPITQEELLLRSLRVQPGLKFRPLLSKEDQAARKMLVDYVLGVRPAPEGYKVAQHLLDRPNQLLDMSRYLNPMYTRILDMISILHQGLPSVNKDFQWRYNSKSSRYYQHISSNIRLVTGPYNFRKGYQLTPHVANLLEYSIFVNQTASQVIGKEAALAIVDKIEVLAHTTYLQGDAVQLAQDWTAKTRKALEDFAHMLSSKIVADIHGPLSQQTGLRTITAGSSKGKEKAKEEDKESKDDGTGYNSADSEELDNKEALANDCGPDMTPPQNLLEDLNVLVAQLEDKHKSTMRWVNGVPEPFGLDIGGLLQQQTLKKVWKEAHRLDYWRKNSCNKL